MRTGTFILSIGLFKVLRKVPGHNRCSNICGKTPFPEVGYGVGSGGGHWWEKIKSDPKLPKILNINIINKES